MRPAMNERNVITDILEDLFIEERICAFCKVKAAKLILNNSNPPRWLRIVSGTDLEQDTEAARLAAIEFCHEYLEAHDESYRATKTE